jgi:glycosyltransferase involved in cell wall biosynthesis
MKINIFVPFIPFKPGGGLKVMFEYANYLAHKGHNVILYYPMKVIFLHQPFVKSIIKYLLYKHTSTRALTWFELDKRVKVKCIFSVNNKSISDGDIIFSTWWSLMFEIKKLEPSKGKVFNLIQDVENWFGLEDKVKLSYTTANSNNLVIAKHLACYVNQQTAKAPVQIPFAVDNNTFVINKPIAQRDVNTISMMYSIEPRKGSEYGLLALKKLKLSYPQLKAILFGVADAPPGLPIWIEYYKNPKKIPELYNQAAIFLSPSIQEGCALPPMEAMCCGCAIVCTDIEGHKEYAFDGRTAILAKMADVDNMVEKISCLLENKALRIKIATNGNEFVKKHTWEASTNKLEGIFYNAINGAKVSQCVVPLQKLGLS